MPRNPNVQAGSDSWASGVQNSGTKLTKAVNAVTESPTVAAARNIAGYQAGVMNAITSGYLERKLLASPLQDWKSGMLTKGVNNLPAAAAKGKPKYQQFASSFYPVMGQASAAAAAIPANDRAGKLARVAVVMDAAEQWKQSH